MVEPPATDKGREMMVRFHPDPRTSATYGGHTVAMTVRELIDTLEKLEDHSKTYPTIIGEVEVRIVSGSWSAPLAFVDLLPNVGYICLRTEG